jgi:hypothetical protein
VEYKKVSWDSGGRQPADNYTFFCGNRNTNHHLRIDFFVHQGIISTVKVKFVSVRMSYIIITACWCGVIVLNLRVLNEDENGVTIDSFYKELQHAFDQFLTYNTEILLDFNEKIGREDIFKSRIGNDSLLEINNVNRVRVVKFAT